MLIKYNNHLMLIKDNNRSYIGFIKVFYFYGFYEIEFYYYMNYELVGFSTSHLYNRIYFDDIPDDIPISKDFLKLVYKLRFNTLNHDNKI